MSHPTLKTAKLRRYTLAEIDAMRQSLYEIEFAHERWWPLEGGWTISVSYGDEQKARSQRIEDQLRTYMLGGVGSNDLEIKVRKAKDSQRVWYEQEQKRLAERKLQAEYGPR